MFAIILTFILILGISTAWVEDMTLSDGFCNVAVLPIEGMIAPYGDVFGEEIITNPAFVRDFLQTATEDPNIIGVLVEINSPGGLPVASETIANALHDTTLPVVGLIGDTGASGAYLIAAATDHLIASPMSYVGSIGVTMSYLEESKKNEKEGLTFVELAAGEFKEAGSPNKPLSEAERARFERDLSLVHNSFIEAVASYRSLPVEEVRALADGSAYVGTDALDKKLIDELGGRSAARAYFADTLGYNESDISFCEYTPSEWLL